MGYIHRYTSHTPRATPNGPSGHALGVSILLGWYGNSSPFSSGHLQQQTPHARMLVSHGFEMAISFMLWSGQTLPIKIRVDKGWRAYHIDDPKVQMQPPAQRSLRNIAETFRWGGQAHSDIFQIKISSFLFMQATLFVVVYIWL